MSGRTLDRRQLQELLARQLSNEGLEVDLVPIPARGDQAVRIRTLEEALADFDADSAEAVSYLVKVRPATPALPSGITVDEARARVAARPDFAHDPLAIAPAPPRSAATRASGAAAPAADPGVYLADGKLNLPYLERNAQVLLQSGDYALARNIWQTLLSSGERADLAHLGIGRCYEAEGKIPEAMRHYEDSIAYQPQLESYRRLSQLLMSLRKDQQAAETLSRALALRDLDPAARAELHKACGNCWLRAERPELAEKQYRAALALQPQNDSALTNLGALHLQLGRIPEAQSQFAEAARLNPRNDQAQSGLGACFLAAGEKRQAHDAFARALEINPVNANAVFHLVKCAYELRTYATAARLLDEYIQASPVNANLLYSLAGMQYHLNRKPEARGTALKILELQPEHPGAKELLKLIDG